MDLIVYIFCAALFCGWFLHKLTHEPKQPVRFDQLGWQLVTVESIGNDYILMVSVAGQLQQFRGSGTIWYYFPCGERASTMVETRLTALMQRYKWSQARG